MAIDATTITIGIDVRPRTFAIHQSKTKSVIATAKMPSTKAAIRDFSFRPLILSHLEILPPRIGENGLTPRSGLVPKSDTAWELDR